MKDLSVLTAGLDGVYTLDMGSPVRTVSGIQVLVQKVVIELLSEVDNGHGTNVPLLLENAPNYSSEEVFQIISEALQLATVHIKANTSKTASKSEQLLSLELEAVENSDTLWALYIRVEAVDSTASTVPIVI